MKSLVTLFALVGAVLHAMGDAAPPNLVGYILIVDQTPIGLGTTRVTLDGSYTYFGNGERAEPYRYEKLGVDRFRVTNFDPDDPLMEWSHLLFTFTDSTTGTVYDEDDQVMKAAFTLLPPAAARLSLALLTPDESVAAVTSQAGQLFVLEGSTNLLTWNAVSTNIAWTGRWEQLFPVLPGRHFYRAVVPTN